MDDHDELIKQFIEITSATEDRARFYLESSEWILNNALTRYYGIEEGEHENQPVEIGSDDDDDEDVNEMPVLPRVAKPKKSKPQSSSNVVTLHSMAQESSDEDEEQGQAFYAGGSERSGQQVLGPPKKNPIKDYVSEIFRSAQESGAEMVDPHSRHAARAGSSSDNMYSGAGYRLGMTDDDHTLLPSTARPQRPQNIEPIVIKLWRDGLSINDGNLRPYDEPENREFLQSIKRGEIPAELRKMGGAAVHVDLENHRNEDFKQPKSRLATFSGQGHTLGSPAPNVTYTVAPAEEPVAAPAGDANAENEKRATEQLQTDETQPTTMIQIRLADGSRLAGRFNQTHTIDDIRRYITNARPTFEGQTFALLTTFPSKELTDGNATIKDAGLLNAAILQRLK